MAHNPATKCLALGSRGYHTWMNLNPLPEGQPQICSGMGCACYRIVDKAGETIPGSFRAS